MATTEDTPPGLDEQYVVATNTSNLRLNPDKVCAATHLIAASLIGNRMGQQLLHLRAEFDAAIKPHKATEAEIAARAKTLPKRKGKPDLKRARGVLFVEREAALRRMAHQMHGWVPALVIMREWAELRGVELDLLSPALYHFLSPICPVCDGLGHLRMEDAPVLGKQCPHCQGEGTWPKPLGAHRVHQWLRGCIGKAKGDRSGLLDGRIDSDDLRERAENRARPAPEDESDATAVAEHFRKGMERAR